MRDALVENSFGAQLRLLRLRARLTQAELGRAVGYSDAQISRLEQGRRPPDLSTLIALFFPALTLDPQSPDARALLALAGAARTTGIAHQTASAALSPHDAAPAAPQHALPIAATPLIGRRRERAALATLLTGDNVRLVTLLGMAGVGKTHLALQVAHDLHTHFSVGTYFIDLGAINDPALVLPTLAEALAVSEAGYADIGAALRATLHAREMLVVLDNFEQVRGAAPLLSGLLAAAPRLRLLVTSRVALRLRAEQLFPLSPLSVPDLAQLPPLEHLAQVESLALLLARLRAVAPDLTLTAGNALPLAAICVRVDGLPLALELVAARGRVLGPQELLAEVTQRFLQLRQRGSDVPPRHQTLAAALAWSYEQLPPVAMALFARLSIFPGAWNAEDAVAVCDLAGEGRATILDSLELLLDHSLLHQQLGGDHPRMALLATVREFAHAELVKRQEDLPLRGRLLAYCLELAEQARQEMSYGPGLAAWMIRLDATSATLRAALDYALEAGNAISGLRLSSALRIFWYTRGYLHDGRRWLERFLNLAVASGQPLAPALHATALDDVALLAWRQGDYRQAETWGNEALTIYRDSGNRAGEARVLMHLGLFAFDHGAAAEARARYEASLPLYRALGEPPEAMVGVMHNLANLYNQLNELEQAMALYHECLAIYERIGDRSGVALISLGMGAIYRDQGEYALSTVTFERCLALANELGDDWSAAVAALNLGDLAADQGDFAMARDRLTGALTMFEQIGDQQMISTTHGRIGDVELLAGNGGAAIGRFRQCLMLASAIEFQHGVAGGLEGLAGCATVDQPLLAARLFGCAASLRAATGVPVPLADLPRYTRLLEIAQAHSDPAAWEVAWAEGARLSPARAVALALSTIVAR